MGSKSIEIAQCGRILLPPELLFLRSVDPAIGYHQRSPESTSRVYMNDEWLASYIIEALIALGASAIAVNADSANAACIASLPKSLARRVTIIDKKGQIHKRVKSLLAPVAAEHNVAIDEKSMLVISRNKSHNWGEIGTVCKNLYPFLLGIKYGLAVQMDIRELQRSLSKLLRVSRDPESRAALSIMMGAIAPYTLKSFDTLVLRTVWQQSLQQGLKSS